jgi:4-amino-4-deoxy-L-arabinose transferase-like glycosyltransferase
MRARPSAAAWVLTVIVTAAFILRLLGLQYGLPAVYNPDEVAIMARSLAFAKGTLNPGNFLYPTFYFYVLFAWVGTYLGLVWLTGGVTSIAALQDLYFTDPTGIYVAGRLLTAVCGTLTVAAVYRLGRRLFDTQVAIAAALFLAVAPLAVRDSHYVKHDIPVTLAIVLAHIAIVRIWPVATETGGTRDHVPVAAAACGVAFATHYYSVFLVLPLTWAIVQRWRQAGWHVVARHLTTAAILCATVFFLLSPFILVEPLVAWRDITANRQIVVDRAIQHGAFGPASRYAAMLWTDSVGRAVAAIAIAGAACMSVVAPRRATLLLAFPASFFLFILNTAPASRYLNPLLPFVALFAAWTIDYMRSRLRLPRAAGWVIAASCAISPVLASLRTDAFLRTDDTRTLAQRFVEGAVPAGSSVLIQPYSVPLRPSRASLEEALTANLGSLAAASTKFQIQLRLVPYPAPAYRLIWLGRGGLDADKIYIEPARLASPHALTELKRLGVTYVILKRYNMEDSEVKSLAAELSRRGRLIATFSPYRPEASEAERARTEPFLHNTDTRIERALERPGPPLEIWQLDGPDS